MDWKWIIGLSVTLGLAVGAGVWGAIKGLIALVAQLVSEATTIKVQLSQVIPVAQELPSVKQEQAVHKQRLDDHDDEIDKLRTKVNQ